MVKYIPDYYKILRIDTKSDKNTIKKAYKTLSKEYNPENDKKRNSKKMYKLINDAYIVLSDDKKRKKYDKIRKSAIQNKNKPKRKKKNVKEVADVANDVKDAYDIISKLFEIGSSAMKGKTLFTGTNLLIGGAMAGYGVKKGRDYMAKRGKFNKE